VKLIASSLGDAAPQFSPDGQQIAFGSVRTGRQEIWVSDRNGANPIAIASLGKRSGTPRWSPDGRQIVFDSLVEDNWDIYVVGANGGQPRRLTNDPAEDACGSWSRDGRWIYFGSSRSGSLQIWKMPAEGGQAVQMTRQGGFEGFEGFESPDGRYFYYAKGRRAAGIWRIPVAGGEETLVLDHHRAGYWRYWAVTAQGIYFATAELPARPLIEFFSFATGKVTLVATIEKQIQAGFCGLAVSPDNRWVLYTQLDQRGSDIMLMENFR
jgi:dipeptidyl aminopeptidase/acylaminoacyl peptidase